MQWLSLVLPLAVMLGAAVPAWADCTCIYAGGIAKQGETACIKTAAGPRLARCEMVLNNSSWTVLDRACDIEQTEAPPQSLTFVNVTHQS